MFNASYEQCVSVDLMRFTPQIVICTTLIIFAVTHIGTIAKIMV